MLICWDGLTLIHPVYELLMEYDWSMSTVDLTPLQCESVWSSMVNQYQSISITFMKGHFMLFTFPKDAFRFAIPKFLNNSTNLKPGTRKNATPGLPLLERGDELLSLNKKCYSRRTGVRKDTDTQPRAFGVNSGWMAEIIGHAEFSEKRKIQTQSWMLTFFLVEKTQADMCEWFVAA